MKKYHLLLFLLLKFSLVNAQKLYDINGFDLINYNKYHRSHSDYLIIIDADFPFNNGYQKTIKVIGLNGILKEEIVLDINLDTVTHCYYKYSDTGLLTSGIKLNKQVSFFNSEKTGFDIKYKDNLPISLLYFQKSSTQEKDFFCNTDSFVYYPNSFLLKEKISCPYQQPCYISNKYKYEGDSLVSSIVNDDKGHQYETIFKYFHNGFKKTYKITLKSDTVLAQSSWHTNLLEKDTIFTNYMGTNKILYMHLTNKCLNRTKEQFINANNVTTQIITNSKSTYYHKTICKSLNFDKKEKRKYSQKQEIIRYDKKKRIKSITVYDNKIIIKILKYQYLPITSL